ncbi:hypothetical protein D3C83_139130 [compost metagenome]
MLGQRQQARIPGVGAQAQRVVDRKAGEVAHFGAGHALDLILVKHRCPHAGEVDLRRRRMY